MHLRCQCVAGAFLSIAGPLHGGRNSTFDGANASRPAEPQDGPLPNELADLTKHYPRLLRKRDRALEVLESKTHWLELM